MMLALFTSAGVAGLIVLGVEGLLWLPFTSDNTGLTYVIAGLFLTGVVAVFRGKTDYVERMEVWLPYLGLIGTVVGFSMALLGAAVPTSVGELTETFGAVMEGMGTALYTTLLGSVGALWLHMARTL